MATTGGVSDGTPQTLDSITIAFPVSVGVMVTSVSKTSLSWKQLPKSSGSVSISVTVLEVLSVDDVLKVDEVEIVELVEILLLDRVLLDSVLLDNVLLVLTDDELSVLEVDKVDSVLTLERVDWELADSRADDLLLDVLRVIDDDCVLSDWLDDEIVELLRLLLLNVESVDGVLGVDWLLLLKVDDVLKVLDDKLDGDRVDELLSVLLVDSVEDDSVLLVLKVELLRLLPLKVLCDDVLRDVELVRVDRLVIVELDSELELSVLVLNDELLNVDCVELLGVLNVEEVEIVEDDRVLDVLRLLLNVLTVLCVELVETVDRLVSVDALWLLDVDKVDAVLTLLTD